MALHDYGMVRLAWEASARAARQDFGELPSGLGLRVEDSRASFALPESGNGPPCCTLGLDRSWDGLFQPSPPVPIAELRSFEILYSGQLAAADSASCSSSLRRP